MECVTAEMMFDFLVCLHYYYILNPISEFINFAPVFIHVYFDLFTYWALFTSIGANNSILWFFLITLFTCNDFILFKRCASAVVYKMNTISSNKLELSEALI